MNIDGIETTLYRIPLPVPVQAASHGVMREFDMVAVRIATTSGAAGVGYTVLNAGHGGAAAAIVENVFKATLLGADSRRIEWPWRQL